MNKPVVRKLRCAVYTRKSSEEGLEQEFNSLHAQREACESYIASQRSEGWVLVRDQYDDGGITGLPEDLRNLSSRSKVEIAQFVLHGVETGIRQESVDYLGTKDFVPHALNSILADKTLKVSVQGETGLSWSESKVPGLSLIDLGTKDWHIYDDSYGTDQEKHFVRFLHDNEATLKAVYQDFHLMRNEKLFQLFDFKEGRAFEPDFVLFLRRADNGQTSVMQIFIEPKGDHLRQQDQWKEDFLKQINQVASLETVFQGRDYTVYGLPFFNDGAPMRKPFEAAFERFKKV